jgi:hypothetical protein
MTTDQTTILINEFFRMLPSAIAFVAALFAYLAQRLGAANAVALQKMDTKVAAVVEKVDVVHDKVNGLTAERVQAEKERGQAAVKSATELGEAKVAQARAEGHSEGVAVEQERGIKEQIRIKQAGPDTKE